MQIIMLAVKLLKHKYSGVCPFRVELGKSDN